MDFLNDPFALFILILLSAAITLACLYYIIKFSVKSAIVDAHNAINKPQGYDPAATAKMDQWEQLEYDYKKGAITEDEYFARKERLTTLLNSYR